MKILFICLVLMAASVTAHSQASNPTKPVTKQDYLQRSKNQKLAAWLFLAGGGTLFVLGVQDIDNKIGNSDKTRSAVAVVTGLAAVGVSTTLFISSARNKRKAMGMAFKMEKVPVLQQGGFVNNSYPALSLKVKL